MLVGGKKKAAYPAVACSPTAASDGADRMRHSCEALRFADRVVHQIASGRKDGIAKRRARQSGVRRSRRQSPRMAAAPSTHMSVHLRRSRPFEDLIPWLYLRRLSAGEFPEALQALLRGSAQRRRLTQTACNCLSKVREALRRPGGALGPRAYEQPHREHLLDDPLAASPHEGQRLEKG